jgi:hypothetical protein
MKKMASIFAAALIYLMGPVALVQAQEPMSFFVTSEGLGDGANLGGLTGADFHCQTLAAAAGSTRTFQAYLSTKAGDNGVTVIDARDRIGTGPWYNARGQRIARSVEELHGDNNGLNKVTAFTEKADAVNGVGDMPNMHDIMTGSQADGRAYPDDGMDHTCVNYTSNRDTGSVQVGHSDRTGGGFTSWNAAHGSRGCSQDNLEGTGGAGLFYCFAID